MNIEVRALAGEDWHVWRALRLEALRESPEAFGSTYDEWIGASGERWLKRLHDVPFNAIAYAGGTPCGIISGTEPHEGVLELISLWVAPQVRGRGAGDALVLAVLAFARERAASAVRLSVRETNSAARALYERHGFADDGASPDSGGPPERSMIRYLY